MSYMHLPSFFLTLSKEILKIKFYVMNFIQHFSYSLKRFFDFQRVYLQQVPHCFVIHFVNLVNITNMNMFYPFLFMFYMRLPSFF